MIIKTDMIELKMLKERIRLQVYAEQYEREYCKFMQTIYGLATIVWFTVLLFLPSLFRCNGVKAEMSEVGMVVSLFGLAGLRMMQGQEAHSHAELSKLDSMSANLQRLDTNPNDRMVYLEEYHNLTERQRVVKYSDDSYRKAKEQMIKEDKDRFVNCGINRYEVAYDWEKGYNKLVTTELQKAQQ
jgi:hypothetical protein